LALADLTVFAATTALGQNNGIGHDNIHHDVDGNVSVDFSDIVGREAGARK
jgi:hypothetical protein